MKSVMLAVSVKRSDGINAIPLLFTTIYDFCNRYEILSLNIFHIIILLKYKKISNS